MHFYLLYQAIMQELKFQYCRRRLWKKQVSSIASKEKQLPGPKIFYQVLTSAFGYSPCRHGLPTLGIVHE